MMKKFDDIIYDLGILYTEQQKVAVEYGEGAILVLAVPGAGKTSVLLGRTARLIIDRKIKADNILSLTFSKSAALEMEQRFLNTFGYFIEERVKFQTIHSFSYEIFKSWCRQFNKKFTLIEQNGVKNKIISELYLKYNKKYPTTEVVDQIINEIGCIKGRMQNLNFIKNIEDYEKIESFDLIYLDYEQYKKENNFIDFDDMLSKTLDILDNHPKTVKYLQDKYKYIQIDEAQDTSKLQFEIINRIANKNSNIFIVADDDQCIYKFRGADPKDLLDLNKLYPEVKIIYMEQNFRSTKNIVSVSKKLIDINNERYYKRSFTENSAGEKSEIHSVKEIKEELDIIIEQIKRNTLNSTTAVLFRNNVLAIPIISRLSDLKIKFHLKNDNNFFENNKILNDLLNIIKFSYNPTDVTVFLSFYYKLNLYIGNETINKIKKNKLISEDICEYILKLENISYGTRERVKEFSRKINYLRELPLVDMVNYILYELDYAQILYNDENRIKDSDIYTIEAINYIFSNIECKETLFAKMEEFKIITKYSKVNNDSSIILSTIHSVKGLEFDNVIIIGLTSKVFPREHKEDKDNTSLDFYEEERRLMYVAMTRAKNKLIMITRPVMRSKFINEILKVSAEEVVYRNSSLHKKDESIKVNSNNNDGVAKDRIEINKSVNHIKFGQGKITKVLDNNIYIYFEEVGEKKLNIDLCIKNNLIEFK